MLDYYTKAEADTAHQEIVDNMTTQFIEMKKGLDENLNDKVSNLATKDDIKDMKDFMKNMHIGFGVLRFSWDNSAKIGSLALLLLGVYLFFKLGIIGVLAYFLKK